MAITILIPDASIFLHAILAISNFAGLKLFLWWNRSRFTLSADGLIGGRIFLVLEGRQIYLSSDDDLFLCEVLATDFLSLFDDIPLNFRSFLAIEIDHDTSLILAPTEVDNCFLTIRVVPQEGIFPYILFLLLKREEVKIRSYTLVIFFSLQLCHLLVLLLIPYYFQVLSVGWQLEVDQ